MQSKNLRFLLFFCGLYFLPYLQTYVPLAAHAQGIPLLKEFVQTAKSAQGSFQQIQFGSSGKVIAKTAGHFRFLRPGKFIWATAKPYEQLLQSDGNDIFIWDKDLKQVTIRKLDNVLASSPAAILFGTSALERYFKIKEGPVRNGLQWVELTPLTQDTPFIQITVGFRGKTLAGMELRDTLGNMTALVFSEVDTTQALSTKDFSFKVPSGVDVIRN